MKNGNWNAESEIESVYPKGLQKIVSLFESLPEQEKRDGLISYADQARKWEPKEGETFDLEDVRKDEECTDTVGVFLKVSDGERATFRVTLGPQVQTLTRAMTSILCRGLEDSTVTEILEVPSDFVPKISRRRIDSSSQPDRVLRPDADERDLQSLSRPAPRRGSPVVSNGFAPTEVMPACFRRGTRIVLLRCYSLLSLSLLLSCCHEPERCRNVSTSEETSPNGQLKAITFRRLCPEEHSITSHVSVIRASESLPDGNGNVFAYDNEIAIRLSWLSDSRLAVYTYADPAKATKDRARW